MSALGSSVINKSGKKFAPKAPVRRAAATVAVGTVTSSAQDSIRASVDRQIAPSTSISQVQPNAQIPAEVQTNTQTTTETQSQSQIPNEAQASYQTLRETPTPISETGEDIPQIQSYLESQHAQKHDTTPLPTPLPSLSPLRHTPSQQQTVKDVPQTVLFPSNITQTNQFHETNIIGANPCIVPQKRPLESSTFLILDRPSQASVNLGDNAILLNSESSLGQETASETNPLSIVPQSLVAPSTSETTVPRRSPSTSTPAIAISSDLLATPSAKRRRTQKPVVEGTLVSSLSHEEVDTPIQTTQTERSIPGESNASKQASLPVRPASVQPSTKRKRKESAKAKGKQPVEQGAAEAVTEVVVGATCRSPSRVSKPKKPRNSRKKDVQQSIEDIAAGVVADAAQGSYSRGKSNRRKKIREATPEGAAAVKIVPSKVKMSELCKNLLTGKKSRREEELEKLDKAEALRKDRQQLQKVVEAVETTIQTNGPSESAEERLERLSRAKEEIARAVPNTVIVDGQIQIDEATLEIDRHANAAVEREAEQLEGIDESELTRRVNSGSWLKREKKGQWNEESTDRFYDALRMFGTDFGMISRLFPGRTRRSIKLKFCKEEKSDRQRIKQTLLGERILVDMEEYSRVSNTVFDDPGELERDLQEDRKRIEEEQAAEKQALDEMAREREREVAAESAAVGDHSGDDGGGGVDDTSAMGKQTACDGAGGRISTPRKKGRKVPKSTRRERRRSKAR